MWCYIMVALREVSRGKGGLLPVIECEQVHENNNQQNSQLEPSIRAIPSVTPKVIFRRYYSASAP